MSTTELDVLILDNLADLDATARRLEQIDATVWRAVDSVVERWAEENGWVGVFDVEGKGLWVTPARWRSASEDEENPDATFWFEVATHDPPCFFDLADLCGLGGSRYGFRFYQKLLGKADWKELARKHAASFRAVGMHLDSKASPFVEVTISPEKLRSAVETGDFGEALSPVVEVLARLAGADKALTRLLFRAGSSNRRPAAPKRKPARTGSRRSK